ncbi:MAG: hypothetical protein GWP69_12240 [Gammaproteobacteria bacterium]|nr:hypothetical protein [Gammaproteobacteria bacterium]
MRSIQVAGDAYDVGRGLGEVAAAAMREVVPRLAWYQAFEREWVGSSGL